MLQEKQALCESDEYGRDLDECQAVCSQWEATMRQLAAAGERVAGELE